jgi:hypothetical protein
MTDKNSTQISNRYRRAVERRSKWEALWRECYAYALPQYDGISQSTNPGENRTATLFDGTAPDGVDQLASSLLGELTPPWGRWFSLTAGSEASPEASADAGKALKFVSNTVRGHFERSNFAIEMHQCFLDLVTVGTACLLFEEAPVGESSAFRFTAIPLGQVAFEEGQSGGLDTTYRRSELSHEVFAGRFPNARLPDPGKSGESELQKIAVIESVTPKDGGFKYTAIREAQATAREEETLASGVFKQSPFINFRWLKAPGEVYGRSPVMKTLPDIKTANKVVELVLKNASIAVTGIWQADDDGVLNPATIQLTPGTIIPKAVGSQGLTPLAAPGSFDVSQLVLTDLRDRIRSALLVDKLSQPDSPSMTATEVLERSAAISRTLGATYGRLQSELLVPLMHRALSVLARRGDIPAVDLDGRAIAMTWRSPLAQSYTRHEAGEAMRWMESIRAMGPEAVAQIDPVSAVHWLAKAFDIPESLLKPLEQEEFANDTGALPGLGTSVSPEDIGDALTDVFEAPVPVDPLPVPEQGLKP